jgi:phage/plasmid-like protein (TIGR03299 family)
MTAAVETMAWTGEVPWHGLGQEVTNKLSPEEMLVAAGIDWEVEKRKIYFELTNGKMGIVPDQYALTRKTDEKVLSVVGRVYKEVQNHDAVSFFKDFTEAGDMTMETMGSLWGGRHIWALARIGKDIMAGKGKSDELRNYLLMCSSHVQGKANIMQFTSVRVVCWNTLTMALGGNLKGAKDAFRMPHYQPFNDNVKTRAQEALGLAIGQVEEYKTNVDKLVKAKVSTEQVEEYFCEVLQFDPKAEGLAIKADGTVREPYDLPKFRAALTHAPGAKLPTAIGTAWGAYNAVTYVVDHDLGKDRSTALKNIWLGHKSDVKRRAFDLALEVAG